MRLSFLLAVVAALTTSMSVSGDSALAAEWHVAAFTAESINMASGQLLEHRGPLNRGTYQALDTILTQMRDIWANEVLHAFQAWCNLKPEHQKSHMLDTMHLLKSDTFLYRFDHGLPHLVRSELVDNMINSKYLAWLDRLSFKFTSLVLFKLSVKKGDRESLWNSELWSYICKPGGLRTPTHMVHCIVDTPLSLKVSSHVYLASTLQAPHLHRWRQAPGCPYFGAERSLSNLRHFIVLAPRNPLSYKLNVVESQNPQRQSTHCNTMKIQFTYLAILAAATAGVKALGLAAGSAAMTPEG
ncbi:uncharacterized protein EDB91DRAFT_1266244 [Suillus paluster]|uniref:uncharacterized protein n=1 Tax=Suillus paluster TaxID=48578 RepID=UPI001B86AD43|nr:uncharacterized protein EDB91DRAFT_1266244 [Suillus paluster]KAG1725275.1 hypothetical protein EDB91DRAFT_1266244 [Suillus paluster]